MKAKTVSLTLLAAFIVAITMVAYVNNIATDMPLWMWVMPLPYLILSIAILPKETIETIRIVVSRIFIAIFIVPIIIPIVFILILVCIPYLFKDTEELER
jgi:hypothetical protein